MGYRSQVAITIVTRNEEDKNRLLALLPEAQRALAKDALTDHGTRLTLHEDYVKWYPSRLVGNGEGFEDVDAIEALMDRAEESCLDWETSDGKEGIDNVGAFIRVGEDDNDIEKRYWGDSEELPFPYELMSVRISIDIDENL